MRKFACASAGLALFAVCASGAGSLTISLIPRDSPLPPDSRTVDIFVDYSGVTDGLSIAGWKFDIIGHANGTLSGNVNNLNFAHGVNDGTPTGKDLIGYAGGQLPPGLGGTYTGNFIGTVTYTAERGHWHTVQLDIVNFRPDTGALNVYTSSLGSQSRPSGGVLPGGHEVIVDSWAFEVLPSPGTAMILCVLPALSRRRR